MPSVVWTAAESANRSGLSETGPSRTGTQDRPQTAPENVHIFGGRRDHVFEPAEISSIAGNNPHRTGEFSTPCPVKNASASPALDSGHVCCLSRWYSKCSLYCVMALASCVATILEKRRPLARWTGRIAVAGAVLCVASVPAMYGGPVNYTGFYNAGGWGPAIVANFPPMIWFLTVSVILIRRPGIGRGVIVRAA